MKSTQESDDGKAYALIRDNSDDDIEEPFLHDDNASRPVKHSRIIRSPVWALMTFVLAVILLVENIYLLRTIRSTKRNIGTYETGFDTELGRVSLNNWHRDCGHDARSSIPTNINPFLSHLLISSSFCRRNEIIHKTTPKTLHQRHPRPPQRHSIHGLQHLRTTIRRSPLPRNRRCLEFPA